MSVDIVDRLRQFTPHYMLSSLGFAMGDERDEDGCKIFFANVPKEWGRGSLDMAMFGGQHLPLSICSQAADEIERLTNLINTPELENFALAVNLEAVHQLERWPEGQDACKTTSDWMALCMHLLGKAIKSDWDGDVEKLKHHLITTAAALNNFHAQIKRFQNAKKI